MYVSTLINFQSEREKLELVARGRPKKRLPQLGRFNSSVHVIDTREREREVFHVVIPATYLPFHIYLIYNIEVYIQHPYMFIDIEFSSS